MEACGEESIGPNGFSANRRAPRVQSVRIAAKSYNLAWIPVEACFVLLQG